MFFGDTRFGVFLVILVLFGVFWGVFKLRNWGFGVYFGRVRYFGRL